MKTFTDKNLTLQLEANEKFMAKDILHKAVREALEKDGWIITHDPYRLKVLDSVVYEIDWGAEKLLAAEKDNQKVAVEVKSFIGSSFAYEFHGILGQYLNYLTFMHIQEPERQLFLAVPRGIYDLYFKQEAINLIIQTFKVQILIYSSFDNTIEEWITK